MNRQEDVLEPGDDRTAPESGQGGRSAALLERDLFRPVKRRNRFIGQLRRHKLGMVGLFVLLILVLLAVFAPLVTRHPPNKVNLREANQGPSREHIFGTDSVGRDMWSRLAYGSRVSLSVGLVAVSIYITIGIVLGAISGYFGGVVDMVIQRFTEMVMCFPSFMMLITLVSVVKPSIFNIMVIIGLLGWTGVSRLVRSQFLSLREQDFVMAARCVGVRRGRIVFRHILPNAMAPVIVAATMGLAGAIMTESGLSFLGLGVTEPDPSWGSMLQTAMSLPVLQSLPWLWMPPAVLISVTVLAFNFLGDALRDALDPRLLN